MTLFLAIVMGCAGFVWIIQAFGLVGWSLVEIVRQLF